MMMVNIIPFVDEQRTFSGFRLLQSPSRTTHTRHPHRHRSPPFDSLRRATSGSAKQDDLVAMRTSRGLLLIIWQSGGGGPFVLPYRLLRPPRRLASTHLSTQSALKYSYTI